MQKHFWWIANIIFGLIGILLFRFSLFAVFWENPGYIVGFIIIMLIVFGLLNFFLLKGKKFKHWFFAFILFAGTHSCILRSSDSIKISIAMRGAQQRTCNRLKNRRRPFGPYFRYYPLIR